ncbi:MAG: hypothetical protein ACLQVI_39685 [Polyangiaceae bacterium]
MAKIETSRGYPFEHGGPERVELRWGASFREVRVLFDGTEVAVVERSKIPREGASVPLPDGSVLSLRLRGVLGIELLRDGTHLPGSDLEPRKLLRNAAILMVLAAAADGVLDGVIGHRLVENARLTAAPVPHALTIALALDAALLVLAIPTALGSRIPLALGIVAFASRFGLGVERSSWTLIYGLCTTWLLATYFFGTFKRRIAA